MPQASGLRTRMTIEDIRRWRAAIAATHSIHSMGCKKKHHEHRRGHGNGNRRRRGRAGDDGSTASEVSAAVIIRPLDINEETRWKPRSLTTSEQNDSTETHDARLLLLLLNKLTPQNFDKVVPVFLSQTTIHQSNESLKHAIDSIVDRASLDTRYAQVYARLCERVASSLPQAKEQSILSFRQALLNYYRASLAPSIDGSNEVPHEEDLFEHPEERDVRLILERHRYVGSKRFLGELYNSGVFYLSDILSFVEVLLNEIAIVASPKDVESNELALEGLCVLLDSCGKLLDETAIETQEMQRCWNSLREMVACENESESPRCSLSFRMKCIVLDLLELRESGWSPKRFSSRLRKEMIAKHLEHHDEDKVEARKSRRRGKRKGKTVRFASK